MAGREEDIEKKAQKTTVGNTGEVENARSQNYESDVSKSFGGMYRARKSVLFHISHLLQAVITMYLQPKLQACWQCSAAHCQHIIKHITRVHSVMEQSGALEFYDLSLRAVFLLLH